MPWYQGPPLLYHLEHVHIASDRNLIDVRFPVQWVIRPPVARARGLSRVRRPGGRRRDPPGRRGGRAARRPAHDDRGDRHASTARWRRRFRRCRWRCGSATTSTSDAARRSCARKTSRRSSNSFESLLCWMSEQPLDPPPLSRQAHHPHGDGRPLASATGSTSRTLHRDETRHHARAERPRARAHGTQLAAGVRLLPPQPRDRAA